LFAPLQLVQALLCPRASRRRENRPGAERTRTEFGRTLKPPQQELLGEQIRSTAPNIRQPVVTKLRVAEGSFDLRVRKPGAEVDVFHPVTVIAEPSIPDFDRHRCPQRRAGVVGSGLHPDLPKRSPAQQSPVQYTVEGHPS